MNIYDFMREPYKSVINGYEPSVLDCWAGVASLTGKVFVEYFGRIFALRNILDMTIREIAVWAIRFFMATLITGTFPLLFWAWGTILYYRLKGAKDRHRKQSERLAKLI